MSSSQRTSSASPGRRHQVVASALCRLALTSLLAFGALHLEAQRVPEGDDFQDTINGPDYGRPVDLKYQSPLLPAGAGILVANEDTLAFISDQETVSTYVYNEHQKKWVPRYFRRGVVDAVTGLALTKTDAGTYLALAGRQKTRYWAQSNGGKDTYYDAMECLYLYRSTDRKFFKE